SAMSFSTFSASCSEGLRLHPRLVLPKPSKVWSGAVPAQFSAELCCGGLRLSRRYKLSVSLRSSWSLVSPAGWFSPRSNVAWASKTGAIRLPGTAAPWIAWIRSHFRPRSFSIWFGTFFLFSLHALDRQRLEPSLTKSFMTICRSAKISRRYAKRDENFFLVAALEDVKG